MKRYTHNIPAARRLRRSETASEQLLWEQLRDRRLDGVKFRRQHAVKAFVLDFYCDQHRLAIEVDGGVHRDPAQRERDRQRQEILEEGGIRFLRISSEVVEHDTASALGQIRDALHGGPGS